MVFALQFCRLEGVQAELDALGQEDKLMSPDQQICIQGRSVGQRATNCGWEG